MKPGEIFWACGVVFFFITMLTIWWVWYSRSALLEDVKEQMELLDYSFAKISTSAVSNNRSYKKMVSFINAVREGEFKRLMEDVTGKRRRSDGDAQGEV